jgi:DNA-directed RNA polymerase subunit M/transcription elongation factor TFIIS
MTGVDEIRKQMELLNDEELLSIILEHSEEQWRPEVFDIVGSILRERGVSPVRNSSGSVEDASAEAEGLDLVTVANYFYDADAETDRQALEAKGLKVWILKQNASATKDAPGVQLKVLADDSVAAMAILESELAPSTDLPPEIAEPPCPKCGSRKVTEQAEIMEAPTVSHSLAPTQVWLYHCASCGHKWSES